MEWINYHHLLYFWVVAKEGTIAAACKELNLAQPTISAQLRVLEKSLGQKLFTRVGRNLALTETGRLVYRHADEIFSLPVPPERGLCKYIATMSNKLWSARVIRRLGDPVGAMQQIAEVLSSLERKVTELYEGCWEAAGKSAG